LKEDYLINVSSLPKIQDNIIRKVIKDSTTNNIKVSKKIVVDNFKTNFVTKNGSVFLEKEEKVMKYGDLEVDNINSFYIGRHIVRNGDRNQKFFRTYGPMSEFYNLNKELFDKHNIFVDKNIIMSGCFKSNKVTLQRTMIPDLESEASSLPSMERIKVFSDSIKIAIRKLKIEQLAKCSKDDMLLSSFNPNTFAGFTYKEYFNKKNKMEACGEAFLLANKRWDYIENQTKKRKKLKRNKLFPNTFVVGARNKREYFYEDNELLSSRAVHMPEFHSELNSSVWIEQITNALKLKGTGPLYIGNSLVKYDRLLKDFGDSSKVLEGDWKRFDSRLYITNIIIGLSIMRCFFDLEDESIDNHFIAMFDVLGIKDYYSPGGHLYRMVHGLPSGVCSTSILGSIINLVNLIYCTKDYPSKKLKFVVGGDDFLIILDNSINEEGILNSVSHRATEIGQVFKFIELRNPKAKKILERPSFFKYTIDRNEPVVFPTALLERVFLPWNKKYNSNFKIYNFLKDLIPSLGAPRSFHFPFYHFYRDIFRKVFDREIEIVDIFKEHKYYYNKILQGERYYKKDEIIFYKIFPFSRSDLYSSSINKKIKKFLGKRNKIKRLSIKEM
jgi:hypothetical protein